MQLAIALSQSEAESKENEKKRATSQIIQQATTTTKEPERAQDEKVGRELSFFENKFCISLFFSFRTRRYLRN